jgi:hypothetical protein
VVSAGDGAVKIIGPAIVANSTLQSAQIGAYYAAKYAGLNAKSYNFTYSILNAGSNVSGPSAGAAMSLLAVSALTGKQLLHNFTITGTISGNGNIGEVGGIYDKATAAKRLGLSFIIVPANSTKQEEALYLLLQGAFDIPLVPVANITQAAKYGFGSANAQSNEVTYNLYDNINAGAIAAAPETCSNGCNVSGFQALSDYTFNYTNSSIASISATGLSGVVSQMKNAMQQYSVLKGKGYTYAASNLAFIVYVDSFYFNNYRTNLSEAINTTEATQNYCASLSIPQLTSTNYEYVMGGELRQAWGYYTANITIAELNNTKDITTDIILNGLSQTGEANGWCHATNQLYSIGNTGQTLIPSQSLASIAAQRLLRAGAYGANIYYDTALIANSVNNYPIAIIDSDYAYTSGYSGTQDSLPTGQLLQEAQALAANSTYGVWATQFSNEAYFYIQEAGAATNTTTSHNYAVSAYFVALLASQLSNDTSIIAANLVPGSGTPSIGIVATTTAPQSITEIASGISQATANIVTGIETLINDIYIIETVNILLTLVLLIAVLAMFQAFRKFAKETRDESQGRNKVQRPTRRKPNENH